MSSVINPELMWIGPRCYRVNIPSDSKPAERPNINYEEEDFNCEIDAEDIFEEIQQIDGKFQLNLHIPNYFYPQIIGAKGATKKRLEQGRTSDL